MILYKQIKRYTISNNNNKLQTKINEQIRSPQVRVINADGKMMGIMSTRDALYNARKSELDLVEISPNAEPPVCKIMDFGKYRYEQQKKANEARKNHRTIETKEIKVRPNIGFGDYTVKLKNAERFITDKNKVRISMQFRGREITHIDVGLVIINRFKDDLVDITKVEVEPKKEGKQIFMILAPK